MDRAVIVIPAYNVAAPLGRLLDDLSSLPNCESPCWSPGDIIVVDDGSRDGTFKVAEARDLTVLRHSCNRGKGAALGTGFAQAVQAGYLWVLTMDADGQHDYRDVPKFLGQAHNADILIGSRLGDVQAMPALRLFTNRLTTLVASLLSGRRLPDSQSGFRLIRTEVLRGIRLVSHRYEIESEMLIKAARRGYRIRSIPCRTIYGKEKSHINPVTDTLRSIRLSTRCLW